MKGKKNKKKGSDTMKQQFRLPALTLAFAALLTSCGGASDGTPVTSASDESSVTGPVVEELPERDLEGFELHTAKLTQSKVANSTEIFTVTEQNGEVLNDAVYSRDQRLGEKYNFTMVDTEFDDSLGQFNKQVLAGDTDYDLYFISCNKLNQIANGDNLIDFHEIPTVDLTKDWWDQDLLRDLDNGNGMYFMNGDLIVTVYDCMRICFYNKDYAEDLGLSGFYDLVRDGKWTIDRMYDMMKLAGRDVNQDAKNDHLDNYGLLYNNSSVPCFITSMGMKLMEPDGTINVFSDRFASIYEKLIRQFNTGLTWNYNDDKYPGLTARESIVAMFDNKQALFFENGLSAAAQYLRDVQNSDYGFLPLPKYDEAQDSYYAYISVSAPLLTVPVTIPDDRLDKLGFVLEALARDSHETVIPVYYETCFAQKFTHDEESYEMLKMACDCVTYDIGVIYDYGRLLTTITSLVRSNTEGYVSSIEAIKNNIIDDYNKVNTKK